MRVHSMRVDSYAQLENVEMSFPTKLGLYCITGRNGTGKTQVLEMIFRAAGAAGILGGSLNYPNINSSFQVTFDFGDEREQVLESIEQQKSMNSTWEVVNTDGWNGLIDVRIGTRFHDDNLIMDETQIYAQGVEDSEIKPGYLFHQALQTLPRYKILMIDENRSYSYFSESRSDHSNGSLVDDGAYESLPFQPGDRQYGEWTRHLIVQEQRYFRFLARAVQDGTDPVNVAHPFAQINGPIPRIFPHIRLIGTHQRTGRLQFATNGAEVDFQQLSSGEREVLFILGLLDMLQLNHGVLLFDEPEMHFPPELVRRNSREMGSLTQNAQVIAATHL